MPKLELTKTQLAALDLIIASLKEDGKPIAADAPMGFIGHAWHDVTHGVEHIAKKVVHAASAAGSENIPVEGDLSKKAGDAKPGEITVKDLIELRKLFK